MKYFTLIAATILSFSLTLLSIPTSQKNYLAAPTTRVSIKRATSLISQFRKQLGRVPYSLSELRAFSYAKENPFTPYDGFANRLNYQALTEKHYLIRSQTSPYTSANPPPKGFVASNLPQIPADAIMTQPVPSNLAKFYPPYYLEGLKHPNGSHYARVFRHPQRNIKTLFVQNLLNRNITYLAPHSGIEEFFWLSENTILFTATKNSIRPDGVYVWQFETGKVKNILHSDQIALNITKDSGGENFLLSLAKISSNRAYFYRHLPKSNQVSPQDFYADENLHSYDFTGDPFNGRLRKLRAEHIGEPPWESRPTRINESSKIGSKLQDSWSKLPLEGSPGEIIEIWQNYSIKYSRGAVFPYTLYWLSCLYHDAYQSMKEKHPEAAEPLRSFGAEIAHSLSTSPATPAYLTALGEFNQRVLREKGHLGFSISEMEVN